MEGAVKTSIVIQKSLLDQAEILAQRLNISQDQLFETAVARFISDQQRETGQDDARKPTQVQDRQESDPVEHPIINQGDIFWLKLENPLDGEASIPHPYVVIQDNLFNHSRIHTVVVCALTSNLKRAHMPGNVLLDAGEANLPRQSVVETSKVSAVDKAQLGEYIGSISEQRIDQIRAGMQFLQTSFFPR